MKRIAPFMLLSSAFVFASLSCQGTSPSSGQSSQTANAHHNDIKNEGFYYLKDGKRLDGEEALPKSYCGAALEISDAMLRIYPLLTGETSDIPFKGNEGDAKIFESSSIRVQVEADVSSSLTVTFASSFDPFASKGGGFNAKCVFQREAILPVEQGEYCFDRFEILSSKQVDDAIDRLLHKSWSGLIAWPGRFYGFDDSTFAVDGFYLTLDDKQFLFDPLRGVYRFAGSFLIRFEMDAANVYLEDEEGVIPFASGNYRLLRPLLTHPHIKGILSSPSKDAEGRQEPLVDPAYYGAYRIKQRIAACSYVESSADIFGPDDISDRAFPEPNGPKVSLMGKEEPLEIEEKDAIVYIAPGFIHCETMKYRFGVWNAVEPVEDRYLALTCGHDYDWWPKEWTGWEYEYLMPECFRSSELNTFFCFYDAASSRYRPCSNNSKADYTTLSVEEDGTLVLVTHRLANPILKEKRFSGINMDSYAFTYLEETIILAR